MMKEVPKTFLIFLLSQVLLHGAGDVCGQLAEAKPTTYGFSPSALSNLEKTARVRSLERFWNVAKSEPAQAADCLRTLLAKDPKDSFFNFDAARLLLTLDRSATSGEAVAVALSHVDLADVSPYDYVVLAIEASKAGGDIAAAALNFGRAKNVDDYAPGAGTRMAREWGVLSLFGRLQPDAAYEAARALHSSSDPAISSFGLLAMSMILTRDSVVYVRDHSNASVPGALQRQISLLQHSFLPRPQSKYAYSRAKVLSMLAAVSKTSAGIRGSFGDIDFLTSAFHTLQPEDVPAIRAARRDCISDPSLRSSAQYLLLTQILHVVQSKAGIFEPAAN